MTQISAKRPSWSMDRHATLAMTRQGLQASLRGAKRRGNPRRDLARPRMLPASPTPRSTDWLITTATFGPATARNDERVFPLRHPGPRSGVVLPCSSAKNQHWTGSSPGRRGEDDFPTRHSGEPEPPPQSTLWREKLRFNARPRCGHRRHPLISTRLKRIGREP